jgi:hypothetical protein
MLTGLPRTPIAIVDKNGYIFALLCGRPNDDGWDGVLIRFDKALVEAQDKVCDSGCQRRGNFINASTRVILAQGAPVSLSVVQACRTESMGLLLYSAQATCATQMLRRQCWMIFAPIKMPSGLLAGAAVSSSQHCLPHKSNLTARSICLLLPQSIWLLLWEPAKALYSSPTSYSQLQQFNISSRYFQHGTRVYHSEARGYWQLFWRGLPHP